ncbi:radical SAM/SPASM domain-containing protein [Methanosphaerula subterraneus]|uniref:radical SAM protein n=1 Tax=Methanosphaerula subterraneus TaxID=3350244 RepID=UPI003F835C97
MIHGGRGSTVETKTGGGYRDLFDRTISETLGQALRIIRADPSLLITGTALLRYQKKGALIRRNNEKGGLLVPPVMIVSITSRCNLTCAGCYMKQRQRTAASEMTPEILRSIVSEAAELGVSVIVIAGGEPLLRKQEIVDLARSFPQILFPVFTNGLLIDEEAVASLADQKNIVPVISFEGFRQETDRRRGPGVYDRLLSTCSLLKSRRNFTGCSVTVTSSTIDQVLDERFIASMMDAGVRAFVFVEYVPIESGTKNLVLTPDQRKRLTTTIQSFSEKFPALFIGFPGDEEVYGGCLAAGRGFVHISPSGDLEPCPAAPFSDANLARVSLKEGLRSNFLQEIRENHARLVETDGGCALWTNQEWVKGLLGK